MNRVKRAFLNALYSLKPDNPNEVNLDVNIDHPRWFKVRYVRIIELGSYLGIRRSG